jgi:hypothetical protein
MISNLRCLLSFILLLYTFSSYSQEIEKIKVKKEDPFLKAEFDNTNYKVIALDKYGNPYEDVVKSFAITFQDTDGKFRSAVMGNTFPKKTIDYLTKKRKKATTICLTEIVAQDNEGHIQNLPDKCNVIIFPDCKNCKTGKQGR